MVKNEDQLRETWSDPDTRGQFLQQLEDRGYDAQRLGVIRNLVNAQHSDLFDVLSYALFTTPPKTRTDRANDLRGSDDGLASGEMRDLLLGILSSYEQRGESELATNKLGQFLVARYGSVSEGKTQLGGLDTVKNAFRTMQETLYRD